MEAVSQSNLVLFSCTATYFIMQKFRININKYSQETHLFSLLYRPPLSLSKKSWRMNQPTNSWSGILMLVAANAPLKIQ